MHDGRQCEVTVRTPHGSVSICTIVDLQPVLFTVGHISGNTIYTTFKRYFYDLFTVGNLNVPLTVYVDWVCLGPVFALKDATF